MLHCDQLIWELFGFLRNEYVKLQHKGVYLFTGLSGVGYSQKEVVLL